LIIMYGYREYDLTTIHLKWELADTYFKVWSKLGEMFHGKRS